MFIRALGIRSPMLKILDFLMDNEAFDYSKADIAEGADVSRASLFAIWPKMEVLDLVTNTREVGRAKMYRLNKQNPIVKKIMELDSAISEYFAEKQCNPTGSNQSSSLSEIIGSGRGVVGALIEYENMEPDADKNSKEVLLA